MGTAGAGLATALSQTISFCILLSMFLRGKTVSQFRITAVTRSPAEFGTILMTGMPSFGRQGLNSIGGMLLNIAARGYGDAAVAGMSIVSRIFMFIISVAIGTGQGFQPVAGFNYGAKKYHGAAGLPVHHGSQLLLPLCHSYRLLVQCRDPHPPFP